MHILIFLLIFSFSYGGLLIKPEEAIKKIFPDYSFEKKSFMIDRKTKSLIQKKFRTKLKSSIFRVYLIKKGSEIKAYGLLHSHRVRTKKETILIVMDKNCSVLDIEVIAFYEPPEYIPPEKWIKNLKGKNPETPPVIKKNIPNITGATLSSRAIADATRQAIGICEFYLKERFR
ncbi:FMN-binding domain-containing protein [Persephonella hydrogeniphila]|uniref:FMN-binding domain-containing protein n=1 Tax=Persephonella hydrogeniphila TaxID=198703 RepID=A0A285NA65_9AQUI|nr:FMN-binding protein [Persephonella hydrogeniphila]SNZ06384.1 FMN-binding domain-containing protein [Persephonella hydrogeniphila]